MLNHKKKSRFGLLSLLPMKTMVVGMVFFGGIYAHWKNQLENGQPPAHKKSRIGMAALLTLGTITAAAALLVTHIVGVSTPWIIWPLAAAGGTTGALVGGGVAAFGAGTLSIAGNVHIAKGIFTGAQSTVRNIVESRRSSQQKPAIAPPQEQSLAPDFAAAVNDDTLGGAPVPSISTLSPAITP